MVNPFRDLGAPKLDNPKGELVEGAFTCQERDCWSTVGEARYLEEVEVLTWICGAEHINKIEGFVING